MKTRKLVAGLITGNLLFALLLAVVPHRLHAAGIVSTPDEASLRAAMAGGGAVVFACDGTIVLGNTLDISNSMSFDGTGHAVTLSGSNAVQVFFIRTNISFAMTNVTVADGKGVLAGGMRTHGPTTLVNCTFRSNSTPSFGLCAGAILNGAKLLVIGSTFVSNSAATGDAGAIAMRSHVSSFASLTAINSTFFGDTIFDASPIEINQQGNFPTFLINCTVAGTVIFGFNSDEPTYKGSMTLINTIAYSVSGDTNSTHNLIGPNPGLGPLADNGGPTLTMALLPGSAAIDAADSKFAPPTDQRGSDRLFGFGPDIGAYEYPFPYTIQGQVYGPASPLANGQANGGTNIPVDVNGVFTIRGLTNAGAYLVSVSAPGASFLPLSQSVTLGPTNALGLVFFQKNALSRPHIANGKLAFTYANDDLTSFRLLSSSNLVNWSSVATNNLPVSGIGDFEAPNNAVGKTFYRTISP